LTLANASLPAASRAASDAAVAQAVTPDVEADALSERPHQAFALQLTKGDDDAWGIVASASIEII
jgi:hypothetical protein